MRPLTDDLRARAQRLLSGRGGYERVCFVESDRERRHLLQALSRTGMALSVLDRCSTEALRELLRVLQGRHAFRFSAADGEVYRDLRRFVEWEGRLTRS